MYKYFCSTFKNRRYHRNSWKTMNELWLHERRLSTLALPFSDYTRTHNYSSTHTAMFKKCFVGDMCVPYRKKITPNQDRVGRVQRFSYDKGWRGLRVSMEFETSSWQPHAFLPGDVHGGVFLSYSILRLTRSEIYVRFRTREFPLVCDSLMKEG